MYNIKASKIDTPLGSMLLIGDDKMLYLLEFLDGKGLQDKIIRLGAREKANIIEGTAHSINLIENELNLYFSGHLKEFTTPIHFSGSDFQKRVWQELTKVMHGETRSYLEQAQAIGNKNAVRAVANANGANHLAIIVPCHRIINGNGQLGGYNGGLTRKKWLINHEKQSVLI